MASKPPDAASKWPQGAGNHHAASIGPILPVTIFTELLARLYAPRRASSTSTEKVMSLDVSKSCFHGPAKKHVLRTASVVVLVLVGADWV